MNSRLRKKKVWGGVTRKCANTSNYRTLEKKMIIRKRKMKKVKEREKDNYR